MPVLGAATLELNADGAKLEADLGRAVQQATTFGVAIGTVVGNALVAAGEKLQLMVTKAIDSADALDKMSQKVGISVEQLSVMKTAAELANVPVAELSSTLKQLSINAEAAARDKGKASQAFRAMGIDVEKFGGDTKAIFDEVMKRLGAYEDGANKTALATAVFGKSGVNLIPLANDFEKTTRLASELGLEISGPTAAAAAKFKDNLTVSRLASEAMGARIAEVLLPTLVNLSGSMVENAKNTEKLDTVTRAADAGLKLLATGVSIVAGIFQAAGQAIGGFAAAVSLTLQGKFKEADETISRSARDVVKNIGDSAGSIGKIWDEAGNKVAAGAEESGKKLAAPALRAADKAKAAMIDAREWIDATMRAYTDEINWIASGEEVKRLAAKDLEELLDLSRKAQTFEFWSDNDGIAPVVEETVKLEKAMIGAIEKTENFGFTFNSAFEDAILKGGELSNVVKALEADIARMILRKSITEPLGVAASGFTKDLMAKFRYEDFESQGWGAGFADGGRPPIGVPSMVGERGPELFVPDVAGTIVPNHALGGSVSIVQNISIDSRSDRASILQAMAAAKDLAVAEVRGRQTSTGSSRI